MMRTLGRRGMRAGNILKPLTYQNVVRGGQPYNTDVWQMDSIPPPDMSAVDPLFATHVSNCVDPADLVTFDLLKSNGAQYGHRVTEWNSSMWPYIYGERKGYHVIDLHYTLAAYRTAARMLQYTCLNGGKILFVNFNAKRHPMFFHFAEKARQPFMWDKWRPGFFTNHAGVLETMCNARRLEDPRIGKGKDLKSKKAAIELRRQAIRSFVDPLDGRLPDAIFFMDMYRAKQMVREAIEMQIPTVGLVDTDCDPSSLMYPIPVNDDNDNAVKLVMNGIATCVESAESYKTQLNLRTGLSFENL